MAARKKARCSADWDGCSAAMNSGREALMDWWSDALSSFGGGEGWGEKADYSLPPLSQVVAPIHSTAILAETV
jgi:hypothetical protein